ncbi:TniB family NTP-binding protein [Nocardioides ultimimeridianus]
MDSYQWHQQAAATRPEPPSPYTLAQLQAMDADARTSYAREVCSTLLACPIPSPIHEAVGIDLSEQLDWALLEPPGARTILAVSAPYAAGKSTLIKQWAHDQYRAWLGRVDPKVLPEWRPQANVLADHVPICYLSLLSESKGKDVYVQLLAFLGRKTEGIAERDLAIQTVRALRLHGVRMVILDDAHMLRTSSATGRATLNAVKHLNTELGELGGVLVLVGAELSAGEALGDPQIRGRLSEHTLSAYGIGTDEQRACWQRFLRSCEAQIMAYVPGGHLGLFANRHAGYLWERTGGYVGDTAKLLIAATGHAIRYAQSLDRAVLEQIRTSERAVDHQRQQDLLRKRAPKKQRVAG